MPTRYRIKPGDCSISLADKFGLTWQTIWLHPDNAELKRKRKDGFVLAPGDVLVVPDPRPTREQGATEKKHRFRRIGVPAKLRLLLQDDGEPIARRPCRVTIGGDTEETRTGADGFLELWVPTGERDGSIEVELENSETITYVLDLGGLDPSDTIEGMQQRLRNLGLLEADVSGEEDDETRVALKAFCARYDLVFEDLSKAELCEKIEEVNGI